jgi:hypothetical protein
VPAVATGCFVLLVLLVPFVATELVSTWTPALVLSAALLLIAPLFTALVKASWYGPHPRGKRAALLDWHSILGLAWIYGGGVVTLLGWWVLHALGAASPAPLPMLAGLSANTVMMLSLGRSLRARYVH